MADAISQLQRVTAAAASASVHLIWLAERGYVSLELPGHIDNPNFGGVVHVTVTRSPRPPKMSDLGSPERLVLESLFGTAMGQRSAVLTPYRYRPLNDKLRELATEELRLKEYIEPSSLIPRLLLAVAAVVAIGAIAVSLWDESKIVGYVLALMAVFALVVIAKEPRGWRASQRGTEAIARYSPDAQFESLAEAVRDDHMNPKWAGLQGSTQPSWLKGSGVWGDDKALNTRTVTILVRSIDLAASQPPPPPKTATGQG